MGGTHGLPPDFLCKYLLSINHNGHLDGLRAELGQCLLELAPLFAPRGIAFLQPHACNYHRLILDRWQARK